MPKKKKSKKTNPRKSFQTAKVEAGEGSDVSYTRNSKDQKHGPESNYKQGAKNSGNIKIKENKKLAKNTKGRTYQEVQVNSNKENTTSIDNEKIVDNISKLGHDNICMQGTISRAIVNVDQNSLLLKKKDSQLNQIVSRNQKTQETGKANAMHKKHELNSDATSDMDSGGIKNDRKNVVNDDSVFIENKMMRGCGASGALNIKENENLGYKEVAEIMENRRKREFESCDTKKVMKQMQYEINDLKNHIMWINRNFFDLREKFKIVSNENEKLQIENETLTYKLKASERENNNYKQKIDELLQGKRNLKEELTQNLQKAHEELQIKNQLISNLEQEVKILRASFANHEEASRRSVSQILAENAITCAKFQKTIEYFESEQKNSLEQVQNLEVKNSETELKWATKNKIQEEELVSLRGEVLSLKGELDELKEEMKVKDERMTKMESQLHEKIKMENLWATKIKVKHEELVLSEERSNIKDEEVALLLNCIQMKDKKLEELNGDNTNMEEQMNALRLQVKNFDNRIEDFEQQISTKNDELSDITNKLTVKEDEFRRNAIKSDKSNNKLFNETAKTREFLQRTLEFLNHLKTYIKRKENNMFSFRKKLNPESTKRILSQMESCLDSSVAALGSVADMQGSITLEMQSYLEAMGWLPEDVDSGLEKQSRNLDIAS